MVLTFKRGFYVLLVTVLVTAIMGTTTEAKASDFKEKSLPFGVVNIQETFNESILGKNIKSELNNYNQEKSARVSAMRKKLEKEAKSLQTKEQKSKKRDLRGEKALNAEIASFTKVQSTANKEIGKFTMTHLNKFLHAVETSSRRVAKKYHMVGVIAAHPLRSAMSQFQSARFVWLDKNVDITKAVVRDMNAHHQ